MNWTDQELLELSAVALGRKIKRFGGFSCLIEGLGLKTWEPLTDRAHALELAVTLRLHVKVFQHRTAVAKPELCDFDEAHGNDANAATCRAIVRTAAYVGEGMLTHDQMVQMFPHHFAQEARP